MRRLLIAILLLSSFSLLAKARLIEWEATSGLMPWDPAVPADLRFAVHEEASFAALDASALHVNDNVVSKRFTRRWFSRARGLDGCFCHP
jgi:hypothetical protein